MKTIFKSEEPKKLIYRDYSHFSSECFRVAFMFRVCQEKHGNSDFENKFMARLKKHTPKKIKKFRDNQKHHINKTRRKAITEKITTQKQSKQNSTDVSNYQKTKKPCSKSKQSV